MGVDTRITQGACAYPITPSTPMGEAFERSVAAGETNLWGEQLVFLEPESEHTHLGTKREPAQPVGL